jgi:hypothetical protein
MTHIHHESVSSLNPLDYCVILSIAKNLKTYTLCIQILHYVQDDIDMLFMVFLETGSRIALPLPIVCPDSWR